MSSTLAEGVDLEKLTKFLAIVRDHDAEKQIITIAERPNHYELVFANSEIGLCHVLNRTGKLQFSKTEEVRDKWIGGQTVWTMNSFGIFLPEYRTSEDLPDLFNFLNFARGKFRRDVPFVQGPREYRKDSLESLRCFRYTNDYDGDISKFRGQERVTQDGKEAFILDYFGGLII
jgi:hypothetical protein